MAVACAATLLLGCGGLAFDAILWGVLFVAVVARPFAGLCALLVGCFLARFSIATGTYSPLEFPVLLMAILAALWLGSRLWERGWGVLRTAPALLLVAFAAVAVAAFARANLAAVEFPLASLRAQLAGLATLVLPPAAALITGDWVRRRGELGLLQGLYLLLASGLIATRTVPELLGAWTPFAAAADGSLLWVWAAALAFSHACFNRSLAWPYRVALAVVLAGELWYGLGINRTWVSGWLPPLVAIAAVVGAALPRSSFAAAIAACVVLFLKWSSLWSYFMVGDNAYSMATRMEAGRIVLDISASHPLLGRGPVNYYPATALYQIRGYHVPFSSHNNYLDLLAQTGALGLLLFVAFLVLLAWRTWRRRDATADPAERAFFYGALGGIAGTAVAAALGDWVTPFVYNVTLGGLRTSLPAWVFLGCLLALCSESPVGGARSGGFAGASRAHTSSDRS